jgi:hypothetical protein
MKMHGNFTFYLDIVGNTGYNNQSNLTLYLTDIGALKLPYASWNFKCFENLSNHFYAFDLDIPSGRLKSLDSIRSVEIVNSQFQIRFSGCWEGKSSGLLGGMSVYGLFKFDRDSASVLYSIFAPSSPCFWGVTDGDTQTSFAMWKRIMENHTDKYGYNDSKKMASHIAEGISNKTISNRELLQWVEDLIELSKV